MIKRFLAAAIFFITSISFFVSTANANLSSKWILKGTHPKSYEIGNAVTNNLSSVIYLSAKADSEQGFGTIMQTISAEPYRGKRLKMSGRLATEDVTNWAVLWMRIDGKDKSMLGFDNMHNRPISGTTGWKNYEIVLDIPHNSKEIAFGVLLVNRGKVLLDGLKFEEVDKTTPLTDVIHLLPN